MPQMTFPSRLTNVLSLKRNFRTKSPSKRKRLARRNPEVGSSERISQSCYRHASPSGPWPWLDLGDDVDRLQLESSLPPIPPLCDHTTCDGCYTSYPQSHFPNWTYEQVVKSKIYAAIHDYDREKTCILHRVDVDINGFFTKSGPIVASPGQEAVIWDQLIQDERPAGIRVRAMFIEHMSGSILQILGSEVSNVCLLS
ncbi:hypothetical protein BJ912DRAFT_464832 [Pholiota molesta]|nr:hypothetical protein BJ912DRAFT_464832 [Pholiota molesta]